ncbi:hypothetical protein [Bradyrhizobium elkanii]|uniref:hypothetical protein n=1 Tax=Bradyrhizobium elkanii TaxID=29448 RepID=UPI001BA54048|nr:hypothetical protein [Bradyrhizobium elkanii]MBR1159991.1 hypothetical protein [Bradyrhizobium elkanii]
MAREFSPSHIGSMRRNFIIGRSCDGSWVVRAIDGFVEATFPNRSEAIRFAHCESGRPHGAVVLMTFTGDQAGEFEARGA